MATSSSFTIETPPTASTGPTTRIFVSPETMMSRNVPSIAPKRAVPDWNSNAWGIVMSTPTAIVDDVCPARPNVPANPLPPTPRGRVRRSVSHGIWVGRQFADDARSSAHGCLGVRYGVARRPPQQCEYCKRHTCESHWAVHLRPNSRFVLTYAKPFDLIRQGGTKVRIGGESGIRTHGRVSPDTRFPSVLLQPLGHLSVQNQRFASGLELHYRTSALTRDERYRPAESRSLCSSRLVNDVAGQECQAAALSSRVSRRSGPDVIDASGRYPAAR